MWYLHTKVIKQNRVLSVRLCQPVMSVIPLCSLQEGNVLLDFIFIILLDDLDDVFVIWIWTYIYSFIFLIFELYEKFCVSIPTTCLFSLYFIIFIYVVCYCSSLICHCHLMNQWENMPQFIYPFPCWWCILKCRITGLQVMQIFNIIR